MPATIALIKAYFEDAERQRALSYWSIGSWGGSGVTSFAGGAIATYMGWRWIFIFSIIFALLAMWLIRDVPESRAEQKGKFTFDFGGLAIFIVTMVAINVLVTQGADLGWTSLISLGLAAIAIIGIIVFVRYEMKRKTSPLIDFKLFKNKPYTGATISNFLLNAVAGTLIVANTYVQVGRGFTSFQAGMLSIGYLVAVLAMIRVGEKIMQRVGARNPMIWGTIITLIGVSIMALTFLPDFLYTIVVFVGFILFGLGLGMYATPSTDTAVAAAPDHKVGEASGIYKMASSLGNAFGVAISAAVFYGNKDVRIEERDVKPVKDNDVKVRVSWSGICGTDLHEYEIGPLLVQVDKPHPKTGEQAPLVLGHEFSGVVEEVGNNVTKFKKGDRVVVNPVVTSGKHAPEVDRYYEFYSAGLHTDGSFAEYFVANEDNVVPVPDNLPLDKAALVEPLSVAAQAVKEAEVKEGDSVAVFGAGPIGLFVIVAAKAAGAKDILAFDLSDERLEKAKQVGATEVLNTKDKDAVAFIKERFPEGVDASLEVAGVKPTFDSAINSTKPKGNVVVVAIHARNFEFNPIVLMTSGVKLSSSMGYEHETFKKSIDILLDENVNVEPIMTKKIQLDDLVEEGFHSLSGDLSQAKILVEIGGEK